jgi:hypothetical protein
LKWQKEKNKQEQQLIELIHSVFDPLGKNSKEASRFDEERIKKI